jgi:hypothetical protein
MRQIETLSRSIRSIGDCTYRFKMLANYSNPILNLFTCPQSNTYMSPAPHYLALILLTLFIPFCDDIPTHVPVMPVIEISNRLIDHISSISISHPITQHLIHNRFRRTGYCTDRCRIKIPREVQNPRRGKIVLPRCPSFDTP